MNRAEPYRVLLVERDLIGAPIRLAILQRSGYSTDWLPSINQVPKVLASKAAPEILLILEPEFDEQFRRFCQEVRKNQVAIFILGRSASLSRYQRQCCDAYEQALRGPSVWLETLARLAQHHDVCRRNATRNILNVDDNEFQRYATSRMLRHDGYQVMEAGSGEKTLELALKKPDLILLDVNLPDIHGFEVCRRLRANPVTSHIPIMHLSATYTSQDFRSRGLANGANEYLCQPVAREALLGSIENLLGETA
jgi:CheY-like chemotaxis protein